MSLSLRGCCDACSGVVSPACLPVSLSPRSDAGRMAPGSCLPLVFRLPVSAVRCQIVSVSAVRCQTLQGWLRVVSPGSPCVWMPGAVTLALPVSSCPVSRLTLLGIQYTWQQLASAIEKHQARNIDRQVSRSHLQQCFATQKGMSQILLLACAQRMRLPLGQAQACILVEHRWS